MAELAFISGLVGVVGAGTKLSIAIFDFAASIGSAGKEMQHVATEISDLCSVLKQLQIAVSHAHFRLSKSAVRDTKRIIERCKTVFDEMEKIVAGLRKSRDGELFPTVDFVARVKWVFHEKAKVQVLRSTLEACKTTLSVMLMTMLLAEHMAEGQGQALSDMLEQVRDKEMTQSLIIAQQCAIEQLEHDEDTAEKEDETTALLPPISIVNGRENHHQRRKSRSRLVRMFSGLSVVTDLPAPDIARILHATRADRASIWLDAIVAAGDEALEPHPGKQRQRRLSSVATADAPMQLLQKWTDQGRAHKPNRIPTEPLGLVDEDNIWHDSGFSFSQENVTETIARAPTDLISPKTARVHSIDFHMVAGVDGGLVVSGDEVARSQAGDSCEAIIRSILEDHDSAAEVDEFELCILYGGKQKKVKSLDKPLQLLSHYEDLELDPKLVLQRRAVFQ